MHKNDNETYDSEDQRHRHEDSVTLYMKIRFHIKSSILKNISNYNFITDESNTENKVKFHEEK